MSVPTYPNQVDFAEIFHRIYLNFVSQFKTASSDNSATVFLTGSQKKGYEDIDVVSRGCCSTWSKKKICCVSCLGCIGAVIIGLIM